MAARFQRKEDFPPRTFRRIKAMSEAFDVPEEELWEDLFRVGREFDTEESEETLPEETLLSFPVPKS